MSISPTFQEITISQDKPVQTAQLELSNQSDQSQTFELSAISVTQIDSQGNIVLADKPLSSADSTLPVFITFPETVIQLAPNQTTIVPFVITNSQDLTPGGNYVAIILRVQPDQTDDQVIQSVLPAISSLVLIRKLGGEQYNLSLTRIELDNQIWWQTPKTLSLVFENQGNIHTTPRGQISFKDVLGRVVIEGTINDSSHFVFPRTQRDILVKLRQIRPSWPVMLYTITAEGRASPGDIPFSQQTYRFFVSSSFLIVLLTGSILLGLGFAVKTKLAKKKHVEKQTK